MENTARWIYITEEQAKAVEKVCKKYITEPGFRESDCPDCPIRNTCRMELPTGTSVYDMQERTRIFETAMGDAAEKFLKESRKK